jgi:hypothetical protein
LEDCLRLTNGRCCIDHKDELEYEEGIEEKKQAKESEEDQKINNDGDSSNNSLSYKVKTKGFALSSLEKQFERTKQLYEAAYGECYYL